MDNAERHLLSPQRRVVLAASAVAKTFMSYTCYDATQSIHSLNRGSIPLTGGVSIVHNDTRFGMHIGQAAERL